MDGIIEVALRQAKDGLARLLLPPLMLLVAIVGTRGTISRSSDALHEALLPFSPMGDDLMHGPEKAGVPTNGLSAFATDVD
ncbi:ADP-ribosylglyco hydrolase [Salmonella bongori]|nr:ADP-ribosylglyco hydrolase [Salmonella bongori]